MSKSKELLENLSQFTKTGNYFRTAGQTVGVLEPGVYQLGADMRGLFYEKVNVQSDSLIKIKSGKYNYITEEIEKFWNTKAKFDEVGAINKRAMLFHSLPGMGKSCIVKQIQADMTEKGNITFIANNLSLLSEAVKDFREVEPERKLFVVLEELDEILHTGSKAFSDLLDGPTSVGNVFYLATTNYVDRIPARMKRPSRFDRITEMLPPDEAERMEFFQGKLGKFVEEEKLKDYVKLTDKMSYAHLKEFVVSVHCLDISVEETVKRLQSMIPAELQDMKYGYMESKQIDEMIQKKNKPSDPKIKPLTESHTSRVMKSFK